MGLMEWLQAGTIFMLVYTIWKLSVAVRILHARIDILRLHLGLKTTESAEIILAEAKKLSK